MRWRKFGLGGVVVCVVIIGVVCGVSVANAQMVAGSGIAERPQVPCEREAKIAYGEIGKEPLIKTWDAAELGKDWAPPACSGWSEKGFSSLITIAGRFRSGSDASAMVQRVGAISSLASVKYWSTTHKKWRVLITEAAALKDADVNSARGDFMVEEMKEGATLYFEQVDNLSGKGVYRMQMRKVSGDEIIFEVENVSLIRKMLIPFFHPGDAQAVYFLEKEPEGVWRYYSMVRTGKNANGLVARNEASLINRAMALYRHLAGIPTDQEPPAAR